jgi:2-polyprenyl-3-methyl-5-hydroxy-6-metoxy-1,4-benzoquinol methylase
MLARTEALRRHHDRAERRTIAHMLPWYQRQELWTQGYDWMCRPDRVALSSREVDALIRLAGLRPGSRVLDIPCGKGRHTLALARRGFAVTGVDLCAPFVGAMAAEAAASGLSVDAICADMREYTEAGAFHAVLNLFTSFGYFEDRADDRRTLERFRACLGPGGMLVMDLLTKETLARSLAGRDWQWLDADVLLLEERAVEQQWSWLRNTWTVIDHGQKRTFVLEHRLYAASELVAMLHEVGFTAIRCFGGLEGSPYDVDAKRLVLVARR